MDSVHKLLEGKIVRLLYILWRQSSLKDGPQDFEGQKLAERIYTLALAAITVRSSLLTAVNHAEVDDDISLGDRFHSGLCHAGPPVYVCHRCSWEHRRVRGTSACLFLSSGHSIIP